MPSPRPPMTRASERRWLLAFDTGLATGGAALIDILTGQVHEVILLTTEKSDKKRSVSASSDTMSRARDYVRQVRRFVGERRICAVAHESLSLPRNSRAAALIGISLGVIACITEMLDAPLIEASPQEVKLKVAGKKSASKDEVISAVIERQPDLEAKFSCEARGKWEHMADSVAVGYTALEHDFVKTIRKTP